MLGRSHCFLGITSTFFFFFWGGGGKYVLLKDTTRQPEWGSNPRPLDPESEVLITRPTRPNGKMVDVMNRIRHTLKDNEKEAQRRI